MALPVSSRSLVASTCVITSSRLVDNKQRSLTILSVTVHVENRRTKPHHFRCASVVEPSTSEHHGHSSAGSEGVSLPQSRFSEEGSRADGSPRVVNRRAAMVASMAVLGVGSACSCCRAALAAEEWSYGGPSGPSKWGGTCAIGAQQSPIDVTFNTALHGESLGELQFDYKLCTPAFKNPGHGTMQVQ
jgi:hypothetical protein